MLLPCSTEKAEKGLGGLATTGRQLSGGNPGSQTCRDGAGVWHVRCVRAMGRLWANLWFPQSGPEGKVWGSLA